ncbi:MAG: DUF58 domain-containing protein [Gemmataceae bacterium]|nr:DUF58 domain-containing protein [Gemmataceae bacterium]
MMTKSIPYAELRQLLKNLGFQTEPFRGKFIRFVHSPDTVFVFRPYQPGDPVRSIDLIAVRKLLDERGLMDADAFDRFRSKAPA